MTSFQVLKYYHIMEVKKKENLKDTDGLDSNSFHICITSYKLVIQDYSIFKRKKWDTK